MRIIIKKRRSFRFGPIGKILLSFLLMWIPLIFLDVVGIASKYNNLRATLNNVYFTVMIFIFSNIFYKKLDYRGGNKRKNLLKKQNYKNLLIVNKIIFLCGMVSNVGIVLLIYDRVFVKGINYSLGARYARYEWFGLEAATTVYGFLGNLFIPFSYVLLFFSYYYFEFISKRRRILGILYGIAIPFVHAFLNGGRMNILVCFIFLLSISILRSISGRSMIPRLNKIFIYIVIVIIMTYILGIFAQSRSFGGNISIALYTKMQVEGLDGVLNKQYDSIILNYMIQVLSYMYHGKWVTGTIMAADPSLRYGLYSYVAIDTIISRFGIKLPLKHNVELFHGAFLNLPGCIFYDFGIIGVIVAPIVFSFILVYSLKRFLSKNSHTYSQMIFLLFMIMFIICAPIAFFFNLGYVNFIMVAFVCIGVYIRLFCGITFWTESLWVENH